MRNLPRFPCASNRNELRFIIMKKSDEWRRLWLGIHELEDAFDKRLVFIGGVAVYLHVTHAALSGNFLEFSHDGDFCISLADFSDLRDMEEVTANPRLHKHQIVVRGIEFDVYAEYQSSLIVSYEDIAAASRVIDSVRVASLEHLLVLKLEAYKDRIGSTKGYKDARDLIRILYMLGRSKIRHHLLDAYMTNDSTKRLLTIPSLPEVMAVCGGNAHATRRLRDEISAIAEEVATGGPVTPRRRRNP